MGSVSVSAEDGRVGRGQVAGGGDPGGDVGVGDPVGSAPDGFDRVRESGDPETAPLRWADGLGRDRGAVALAEADVDLFARGDSEHDPDGQLGADLLVEDLGRWVLGGADDGDAAEPGQAGQRGEQRRADLLAVAAGSQHRLGRVG